MAAEKLGTGVGNAAVRPCAGADEDKEGDGEVLVDGIVPLVGREGCWVGLEGLWAGEGERAVEALASTFLSAPIVEYECCRGCLVLEGVAGAYCESWEDDDEDDDEEVKLEVSEDMKVLILDSVLAFTRVFFLALAAGPGRCTLVVAGGGWWTGWDGAAVGMAESPWVPDLATSAYDLRFGALLPACSPSGAFFAVAAVFLGCVAATGAGLEAVLEAAVVAEAEASGAGFEEVEDTLSP